MKIYKNNRCRNHWQGLESRNITFSKELEFDVSELDRIYEMGVGNIKLNGMSGEIAEHEELGGIEVDGQHRV